MVMVVYIGVLSMKWDIMGYVGVSINGGTPSHTPFIDGFSFTKKNVQLFGYPLFQETPMYGYVMDMYLVVHPTNRKCVNSPW